MSLHLVQFCTEQRCKEEWKVTFLKNQSNLAVALTKHVVSECIVAGFECSLQPKDNSTIEQVQALFNNQESRILSFLRV